jgi:hypothetical protein
MTKIEQRRKRLKALVSKSKKKQQITPNIYSHLLMLSSDKNAIRRYAPWMGTLQG